MGTGFGLLLVFPFKWTRPENGCSCYKDQPSNGFVGYFNYSSNRCHRGQNLGGCTAQHGNTCMRVFPKWWSQGNQKEADHFRADALFSSANRGSPPHKSSGVQFLPAFEIHPKRNLNERHAFPKTCATRMPLPLWLRQKLAQQTAERQGWMVWMGMCRRGDGPKNWRSFSFIPRKKAKPKRGYPQQQHMAISSP